ncbi:DUF3696 domain-containing protein [Pedobacter sp. FW305-3-2-15-E-R2A2]|uniref:DUF3696 domain-containing protein n=1 Tax=Pedobacter sp. FW305-3-2-15-E-R2A2 TaxID=3140251 RepID=UPI00314072BF
MIKKLRLRNFKAFGEFEEDLSSLNLITGLNGMGKSTIIQSLLLLRQSYQMQKLTEKGLFLNGDYVKIGKGKDAYWIHGDEDVIVINLEWDNNTSIKSEFKYLAEEDVLPIISINSVDDFTFKNSLFNDNFQYLNAERIGQRDTYPASEIMVSDNRSLGINGEYTTYFLEKYSKEPLTIKELLHDDNKTDSLGIQINAWLSEISPGVSFVPQSIVDSEMARQFYEFDFGGERTKRFRSTNVGFGLNYVLPVLTAILFSKPGDLLLIENPEAHIHPRGQSKLGYLFALASSCGVQLVIETHSDHVLNGIRVATKILKLDNEKISLFYFSRDINSEKHSTKISRPKLHADGKIDNWPDGFFDEWDNMLDQLI